MHAAIWNKNAGSRVVIIALRSIALAVFVALLSGCESEQDEHVVYSSYAMRPYPEVVEEVYVETYFEVVDEYDMVVEEVEVTWETISTASAAADCGCGDPAHHDPYARKAGNRRRIDAGASATTMPVNDRDDIVFRFRKRGYLDTWVAASDMRVQELGGQMRLERKVVLRSL